MTATEHPKSENTEAKEAQAPAVSSAVGQELMKIGLVQKAAGLYKDAANYSDVTRYLAKAVEGTSSGLLDKALGTSLGQQVDSYVAKAASYIPKGSPADPDKNGQSESAESEETKPLKPASKEEEKEPEQKDQDWESYVSGFIITCMELYFRFFPACLAFRWTVHILSILSQSALALCIDLARINMRSTEKAPEAGETKDEVEGKVDGKVEGEVEGKVEGEATPDSPEQSQTTEDTSSIWLYLLESAYAVFYLVDCFLLIPYLTTQTYFLQWLNNLLYNLAGIEDSMNEQRRGYEAESARSGKPQDKRRWLVDVIIDHALGPLLDTPILGRIGSALGLTRPLRPFRKMVKRWNKAPTLGSKKSSKANYLKEDPNYDEAADSDYVVQELQNEAAGGKSPSKSQSPVKSTSAEMDKDNTRLDQHEDTLAGNMPQGSNERAIGLTGGIQMNESQIDQAREVVHENEKVESMNTSVHDPCYLNNIQRILELDSDNPGSQGKNPVTSPGRTSADLDLTDYDHISHESALDRDTFKTVEYNSADKDMPGTPVANRSEQDTTLALSVGMAGSPTSCIIECGNSPNRADPPSQAIKLDDIPRSNTGISLSPLNSNNQGSDSTLCTSDADAPVDLDPVCETVPPEQDGEQSTVLTNGNEDYANSSLSPTPSLCAEAPGAQEPHAESTVDNGHCSQGGQPIGPSQSSDVDTGQVYGEAQGCNSP